MEYDDIINPLNNARGLLDKLNKVKKKELDHPLHTLQDLVSSLRDYILQTDDDEDLTNLHTGAQNIESNLAAYIESRENHDYYKIQNEIFCCLFLAYKVISKNIISIHNTMIDTQKSIQSSEEQITETAVQAINHYKKIEYLEDSAKNIEEKMKEMMKNAEGILGNVTGIKLAEGFRKRKNQLRWMAMIWGAILIVGLYIFAETGSSFVDFYKRRRRLRLRLRFMEYYSLKIQ